MAIILGRADIILTLKTLILQDLIKSLLRKIVNLVIKKGSLLVGKGRSKLN